METTVTRLADTPHRYANVPVYIPPYRMGVVMDKPELIDVTAPAEACSCCSGGSQAAGAGAGEAVVDPVCGMTVDPATAAASSTFQGQTYYFCAPGCRKAFDKDPASFLAPAT
jgi:YHS domain-containing protein